MESRGARARSLRCDALPHPFPHHIEWRPRRSWPLLESSPRQSLPTPLGGRRSHRRDGPHYGVWQREKRARPHGHRRRFREQLLARGPLARRRGRLGNAPTWRRRGRSKDLQSDRGSESARFPQANISSEFISLSRRSCPKRHATSATPLGRRPDGHADMTSLVTSTRARRSPRRGPWRTAAFPRRIRSRSDASVVARRRGSNVGRAATSASPRFHATS